MGYVGYKGYGGCAARCAVTGCRGASTTTATTTAAGTPGTSALPPGMNHPGVLYVREDAIVPKLDEWIAQLFAPDNIEETCETLAAAAGPSDTDGARVQAAERKLADCDKRLNQYRKALDSGADAAVVAGWMAEVQAERLRVEHELTEAQPRAMLTPEQVRALVQSLGDIASALADADPKLKSRLYEELGVSVTYDHATRTVTAGAKVSVGGSVWIQDMGDIPGRGCVKT